MNKKVIALIIGIFIFAGFYYWSSLPKEKDIWQGAYYEHGKQENEIYSPVFTSFEACKAWALSQKKYNDDTMNCNKNCHDALGDGTPICEIVVRNWAPLPGSDTFDNYKD
ncbi:MAG: hypothetical protein YFSK_1620 [Candidatus Yanofskyibacterium parasiticum]|jgi:hypothetical protein|nr:MAG: hypothetical protein YFSK_1620 [Candidatus Yanofskybacteria bacterium]